MRHIYEDCEDITGSWANDLTHYCSRVTVIDGRGKKFQSWATILDLHDIRSAVVDTECGAEPLGEQLIRPKNTL